MQKIQKIDFSQFADETLIAFSTWKNGNQPVDDVIGFLVKTYITDPILNDTKQFQSDMAVQAMNATIAANVEDTQNSLEVTPFVV